MNMMKKTLVLLLLILSLCVALISCSSSDKDKGDSGDDIDISGDYIFSPKSNLNIVYNGDHMTNGDVSDIRQPG